MLGMDYGASGGRTMLGSFDGSTLKVEEIYRFENAPVRLGDHWYWDFLRLFLELKRGISKYWNSHGGQLASIAVDTWGVDIGFLDGRGRLLANPYHYRDARNEGMPELANDIIPREEMYSLTGAYPWQYNTLFQLLSTERNDPVLWEKAETMLWMPDLFQYFLTGVKASEYTVVSTGGLLDPVKRCWSETLFSRLGLPTRLLAELVQPGTRVGNLLPSVCSELGVPAVPFIATASHDSAAAVVSVPLMDESSAFISCGTWSIMGVESAVPVLGPQGLQLSFTNEGGLEGKTRIVKNIMGLWLLQECRRQWAAEGETADFADMQEWASAESGGISFIDPDDLSFMAPEHMPHAVLAYCRRTSQPVPQSKGQIVRCILDSLALKYRQTVEELEQLLAKKIGAIHMVGGGVNNRLLCQLTADVTGKPVIAGPVEATVAGNLLVQAISHGEIANAAEAREVVARSFLPEVYEPSDTLRWNEAYDRYLNIAARIAEKG
ncbi:rhamnulokinase [Cohnella nanjingensis]|uniref:Rhamnulokinase n=2 Tax=Cohnella nanjingensis TaxID=1387779 RepID=A0A7X0RMD4_9BACL|nr:rhamnulokinase [Cohnella nanjingensis]